jgi:hypothetical protein
MAMLVVKELCVQDMLLFRLEHQWTAHTSSSILVPGYKMYHFSKKKLVYGKWQQTGDFVSGYQHYRRGVMQFYNFKNLVATSSNRAEGAEQNGLFWYCTSNRMKKMATEASKELRAQDVLLFHLEHQWTAHTSSSILVPGYKMYHFSKKKLVYSKWPQNGDFVSGYQHHRRGIM